MFDDKRLEKLRGLLADGWCPCRSSNDDARWMLRTIDALRAQLAAVTKEAHDWKSSAEYASQTLHKVAAERDAALARVAKLEAEVASLGGGRVPAAAGAGLNGEEG